MSSSRYSYRTWRISKLEGHEDRWALFDDSFALVAIGPWDSIKALYDPRKRAAPPVLKGTTPDVDIDLGDLGL